MHSSHCNHTEVTTGVKQNPAKQVCVRYKCHIFLQLIPPQNGCFFKEKVCVPPDLKLSGRQKPVLSCFCRTLSKITAYMRTQPVLKSKTGLKWKG